jgi:hypothetical protein
MKRVRPRHGHARHRADYINRIESELVGAIGEFYKGVLASQLGLGLAAHWEAEAYRIVHGSLVRAVQIPVRGFTNRGDAFMRAVREVESDDARYRAMAEAEVRRDYPGKVAKTARVDAQATRAFWSMVHGAVAAAIRSPADIKRRK